MSATAMDITKKIQDIVAEACKKDVAPAGISGSHFFSDALNLRARDVVHLLHVVEKTFDIVFDEQCFFDEAFYSVDGLSGLVAAKLGMDGVPVPTMPERT